MAALYKRQEKGSGQIQDEESCNKAGTPDKLLQTSERKIIVVEKSRTAAIFMTLLAAVIATHKNYMKNYTDEFACTDSD